MCLVLSGGVEFCWYSCRFVMSHSYASYLLLITFCLVQLSNAICPSKPKSLPDLIYLGFPDGCASATNGSKCNTYLRMAPNLENDSFIDFYLEGNLKGWVAVGFSKDKFMINTDVVGCKQDKSGSLGIINSWNPNVANLSKRHNEIDPNQDLMCNHSIQYEDKRIKCSFSRYSGVINEGYDFDLDGTYYLILGISGNQSPVDEAFPYHTVTPNVSGSQYDVYNYKKPSYPSWSVVLRRTHGILMLVAVALVAPAGTFVSSWLKPALFNGRWLPFHQGLMITSVILILTGFTSIFVANKDNAGLISFACAQQRAHFAIGILVTGLMLINPTLAVFRCKPDSPKRPIFNKIHAPLGAVAVILGHINIGLGIRQFEVGCSDSKELLIFVTYLTWQLGFALVMQVTLNIVFSVIAFKSQGKERYTLAPSLVKLCLKMPASDEYLPINSKRSSRGGEAKRPSKDCKIRLALFGVDTIVNFIMESLPDLIYVGVPENCIDGKDGSKCDIFLRMAPNKDNGSFIDFYLEGNLTGWVAVGFSNDQKMVNTDVVGCIRDTDGSIGVINTWNPSVIPKHNVIDPSQDGMCNYSLKYEDNRLKCSFSRLHQVINPGFDYDLNGSYYLILGTSDNQGPATSNFPYHTVIPTPSMIQYDAYSYHRNSTCPSQKSLPDLIYVGFPDHCIDGKDGSKCDMFLRMAPNKENHSFVDFYLEGNLKGWVAVGFSTDKHMVTTDVVGCIQDKDGSLSAINTWNPNSSVRKNEIDPSQNLMCNHSITYEDKRLKCSFSRFSGIISKGYDFNLNGSFYLILGHSDNYGPGPDGGFSPHTEIPILTVSKFDVFNYNSNNSNGTTSAAAFKLKMKKAHGSLMSISWLLLASTGLFFSMWMKPAFTNGLWFQFHRALMLASLLVALSGFVCIFVATKDNKIPGLIGFECPKETFHFAFGIIVTALMLVNPIIGFIRCKPESPDRWIFNLVHGSVGTAAWILALVNIGLGLSLFQNPCGGGEGSGYPVVDFYVGWLLGFVVLSHIIMFLLFTFLALQSRGQERYELAPSLLKPFLRLLNPEEYTSLNNGAEDETTDLSSKDSKIRIAAFGIYNTVNVVVVSILVVMIATGN